MRKTVKYMLAAILILIVGYNSVYFKKLSEVQKQEAGKLDPVSYAGILWNEKLPATLDSAIELTSLLDVLKADASAAFARYSHAMGIGNYRYSMVTVSGVVSEVNVDDVVVQLSHADSLLSVRVATEYVYGNAIRDASGLLDIRDFSNTADLNSISEALNQAVRRNVLPDFKKQVKKGDRIDVTGAVEFNQAHIDFKELELIPVRISILK